VLGASWRQLENPRGFGYPRRNIQLVFTEQNLFKARRFFFSHFFSRLLKAWPVIDIKSFLSAGLTARVDVI
jgi:hypothetical protein